MGILFTSLMDFIFTTPNAVELPIPIDKGLNRIKRIPVPLQIWSGSFNNNFSDLECNYNRKESEPCNTEILQTFIKEMISFSSDEKGGFSFELLRWSELQPYWCVFACKRDGGECLTGIKGVTGIGGHYCIGEEANLHSVLSELVNSGWKVGIHQHFFA